MYFDKDKEVRWSPKNFSRKVQDCFWLSLQRKKLTDCSSWVSSLSIWNGANQVFKSSSKTLLDGFTVHASNRSVCIPNTTKQKQRFSWIWVDKGSIITWNSIQVANSDKVFAKTTNQSKHRDGRKRRRQQSGYRKTFDFIRVWNGVRN